MSIKVQAKKEPQEEGGEKDEENDTGSSTLPMPAISQKVGETAYKRAQNRGIDGGKCDCCSGCLLT